MKNNRKAYELFMQLPADERKKISTEYDILSVEKTFYHEFEWCNRFHKDFGGSFWNWLWMTKFKEQEKKNDI